MGLKERPVKLAQKQAVSAVGQIHLMRYYQDFFAALGLVSRRCTEKPFRNNCCMLTINSKHDMPQTVLCYTDMCSSAVDPEQPEQ